MCADVYLVCLHSVFFSLFRRRMQGINLTQTRRTLESHQIDSVLRFDCVVLLQYTFTTYYQLDRVGKMIERHIWECREIELGRLQPSLTGPTEHINLLGLQKAAVQLVSKSNSSNAKLEVRSYYNLNNNSHSAHLYFPCQRTKGMIGMIALSHLLWLFEGSNGSATHWDSEVMESCVVLWVCITETVVTVELKASGCGTGPRRKLMNSSKLPWNTHLSAGTAMNML